MLLNRQYVIFYDKTKSYIMAQWLMIITLEFQNNCNQKW